VEHVAGVACVGLVGWSADLIEECFVGYEAFSFAPLGWVGFLTHPTAYAVGYILAPLRGCESSMTTLGS